MNKIWSHNDYIKYQENKKKGLQENTFFKKKELGVGDLSKYRKDIKNLQLWPRKNTCDWKELEWNGVQRPREYPIWKTG